MVVKFCKHLNIEFTIKSIVEIKESKVYFVCPMNFNWMRITNINIWLIQSTVIPRH